VRGYSSISQLLLSERKITQNRRVVWCVGESLLKFMDRAGVIILFKQVKAAVVELLGGKFPLLLGWIFRYRRGCGRTEQQFMEALPNHVSSRRRSLHG
jgi:hypothetical protein